MNKINPPIGNPASPRNRKSLVSTIKNSTNGLVVGLVLATITAMFLAIVFSIKYVVDDKVEQGHAKNQAKKVNLLLKKFSFNNNPIKECYLVDELGSKPTKVFVARMNDEAVAYIVNYDVVGGYSSPFRMIAGISVDGDISYIDLVEYHETPGLGDKILRKYSDFFDSFSHKNLSNAKFDVKKYGGDFDYFTGATVTPRAVTRSTKTMLERMLQIKDITQFPKCKDSK